MVPSRFREFLLEFCQTYFGAANAPEVAALYRDFYSSYWQQRRPTLPGFERQYIFQDLRLNRAMQRFIAALKKPGAPPRDLFGDGNLDTNDRLFNIVSSDNDAPSKLDALTIGTNSSIERLTGVVARADALMPRLPVESRAFFNDNLRTQAHFLLAATVTTHELAQAVRDSEDSSVRTAHLRAALTSARQMATVLAEAEHGPFVGWYGPDRIFNVRQRIEDISGLLPNP